MIVLAGTLKILDSNRGQVLETLSSLQDATRAEDAGLVSYHFSIDMEDDQLVHVYEEWESTDHLKVHGQKEHMDAFRALRADGKIEVVRFSRWRAEELGQF